MNMEENRVDALPNGRHAIVGQPDGKMLLLDLEDGSKRLLRQDKDRPNFEASEDGKRIAFWDEKTLELLSLPDGQSLKKISLARDLPGERSTSKMSFLHEGAYLLAKRGKTAWLLDTKDLGTLFQIDFATDTFGGNVSPDGKHLIVSGLHRTLHVYDIAQRKRIKEIEEPETTYSLFTTDSKHVVTYVHEPTSVRIHELSTGKSSQVELPFQSEWASAAPDGTLNIIGSGIISIDPASGRVLKSTPLPRARGISSSPDRGAVLMEKDDVLELYDLASHRQKWRAAESLRVGGVSNSAFHSFSPKGDLILKTPYYDGKRFLLDAQSGRVVPFRSSTSRHSWIAFTGDHLLVAEAAGLTLVKGLKLQCASSQLSVSRGAADLQSLLKDDRLCGGAFDEKAWDIATPPVSGQSLDPELAGKYLLRFQHPRGFDGDKHLSVLVAILRSHLVKAEPDLVRGALESVMAYSPLLFEDIVRKYPELSRLPFPSSERLCRSASEQELLKQSAKEFLSHRKMIADSQRSAAADWASLAPLSRLLSGLPEPEKEAWRDAIATSIAHGAADTPQFQGVFLSKLYKFAYHSVKPWFGDKGSELTDLTIVRDAKQLRPIVLGTEPIDGDPGSLTAYGFHARVLPPVPLEIPRNASPGPISLPGIEKGIKWKHGQNEYSAAVITRLAEGASVAQDRSAPPYAELWKDGSMTGTVMAGSNLGDADGVLRSYQQYYEGEGFVFGKEQSVKDLHGWLEKEISSGQMDYFVKEAHSDGDEKNLFRFSNEATIRVGTKVLADGRREEVKLVIPHKGPTSLLSNERFGAWIRKREKEGKGALVYFNGSCWSRTKAVNELQAAQSSKLIDIPTLTTCHVFGNYQENAFRIILDNFRKRKNYDEIRTELSGNPDYRTRTKDVYIFPGERDYDDYVDAVLRLPIDLSIKIKDQSGRVVNIDEN